jgi:putative membrane protein
MKHLILGSILCSASMFIASSPALAAGTSAKTRLPDEHTLQTVAMADMTEAHMGEIAKDKLSQPAVRDLAQTIAKDSTSDYEQLSMLAGKTGESIPKGIDANKNPAIRTLASSKGPSFDRIFLRDEVADERRAVSALKFEAAHSQNPEIKSWAQKELPVREQDLKNAQSLIK